MWVHPQNAGGEWVFFLSRVGVLDKSLPSLGLVFPIRTLEWMALKAAPISGCVAESCDSGWFGEAGGLSI